MIRRSLLAIPVLFLFVVTSVAQQPTSTLTVPFFGNKACPISGKPTKPSLFLRRGDEKIFVCCKDCIPKVAADQEAALENAYPVASIIDVKNPNCPIMGGKAKTSVSTTFQGYRVRFCCPGCDLKFRKEPNKHLTPLTSNEKLTDLKNKTCPVNHDKAVLPDSFLVYDNHIVNICCADCVEKFAKDPKEHLATLKNGEKYADHRDLWTCSMHPKVQEPKPRNCSICGMELIKSKGEGPKEHQTRDYSRSADVAASL